MSVESRMNEFTRVAQKKKKEDIKQRMDEFETVERLTKHPNKEKSATLPHGIKPHKSCPHCGEIMTIHEIRKEEVIYCCKACGKDTVIKINI